MNRCVLACAICQLAAWTANAAETDYLTHVKPILRAHCFGCHGALKQEAGLRLDTGLLARRGGDSGPAVIPGSTDNSLLLRKVTHADAEQRMPPDSKPLTQSQIDHIRAWIRSGAKIPVDERPEADPTEHWSFRPLRRPPVPRPANSAWVRNPIDAFIAAEHQARDLTPLPPAGKLVLLRRLYLDLVGLPPTRSELRTFVEDPSPDAYERVVDRLLSSSHYGERWARHWMDIWRYSDWYGRRQVNDVRNSYPHIWRWRDWIVDALNADKGYDQMVREMLAADELYPDDDSRTVALGFIVRNWFSLNYDTWKQDLVEHTGKAFLGLRLNCAHCHDHKYDPISQDEYFAFRAFFEPLEFRHDRVPGGPRLTKYMRYKPGSGASLSPIAAGLARIYDAYVDEKTLVYRLGDTRDKTDRAIAPYAPAILGGDALRIEPVQLPAVAWYPELKDFAVESELASRASAVAVAESELARCRSALPAVSKQLAQAAADVAEAKRDVPDDPKRLIREAGDVIAEWRFEGQQDADFLADSRGGGQALRRVTESDPVTRAFEFTPAGGVKSFPNPLPLTGGNNRFAAEFQQDRSFAYLAADTTEKFYSNTFTLEAFIHCDVSQRNYNRTIAAFDGCWTLLHRGLNADTFELRLRLHGADGRLRDVATAESTEVPAAQRMRLKTGHDYYVCVRVGEHELLFCAADLTANAALQTCRVSRGGKQQDVSDLAAPSKNALFRIGNSDGTGRFHGLIDEVRYTRGRLSLSQIAAASGRSTDAGIQQAMAGLAELERTQRHQQRDLLAAEQQLKAANSELMAYRARTAAARAEFVAQAGDVAELASNAARLEWEAGQAAAVAKLSQAEQELRRLTETGKPDAKKIKQAEQKRQAAAKSAEQAAKSTWDPKSKYTPLGPRYPRTSSGRRRALAGWLASDDNPLTARVAVNHIWMRHFGRPLVDSVFDFGRGGQRPTHPALLDWLAMELMSPAATGAQAEHSGRQDHKRMGRWSMKSLHRLIVTSSMYRLSSGRAGESQGQERIDKENVYRWKSDRRRLESEGVRDCMLFVSGQLDSRFGGTDLDPAREWETRRRSLYYTIYPESGGMMQFLTLFDAPDPCDCYRRTETTVPQQALALSNSRLALILGRQLAARLAVETQKKTGVADEEAFIVALFETVLSRRPRPREITYCRTFLQQQEQLTRDLPDAQLKSPAEKGVVPSSTNPRQRARESLVRVLLNHNEFITIQ